MVVVQHWSHAIKPKAIKVKLLHPPAQVGEKEPHYLPAMGKRERHFLHSINIKSTPLWWNKNQKINQLEHTLMHINSKKKKEKNQINLFTKDTYFCNIYLMIHYSAILMFSNDLHLRAFLIKYLYVQLIVLFVNVV